MLRELGLYLHHKFLLMLGTCFGFYIYHYIFWNKKEKTIECVTVLPYTLHLRGESKKFVDFLKVRVK